MYRLSWVTLLALFSTATWSSDCVQLSDHELIPYSEDDDYTAVTWRASLKNQCDAYVDVDLSVELLDSEGNQVYTVSGIEALGFRESRSLENEVYVPADVANKAKDMKIELKEQKR